jgi:hypothetical protein
VYGITKNDDNTYTTGGIYNGEYTAGTGTLGNLASLGNAYDETTTGAATQQYYDGTIWRNMDSVQDASGNYHWQIGEAAKLDDFGDDDMKTGIKLDDFKTNRITTE